MSTSPISSLDLWASSKFIGRECATQNKAYLFCKKEDENPATCKALGDEVKTCTTAVVNMITAVHPAEFDSFKKCLDKNDYRFSDCREQEKNLLAAFAAAKGGAAASKAAH